MHVRAVYLAALCMGVAMWACGGIGSVFSPAIAAEREEVGTVRPELGPPLQEAQRLIRERKFGEALERLRATDAIPGKTPFEIAVVEQTRLIAAIAAGDPATAAKSYAALPADRIAPRQRLELMRAIGGSYYRTKDYGAAATWFARYVKDGGDDAATRDLHPLAVYLSGDYKAARMLAAARIAEAGRSGGRASESLYRVVADSSLKLGDLAAYDAAMERLVATYPSPRIWAQVIDRVAARPSLSDRLAIDVLRLKVAVGVAETADYVALVEHALAMGLPGEARSAVESGFAAGKLGVGEGAARHARLRVAAAKAAEDDRADLASADAAARAGRDGIALVNAGMNRLGHGDASGAVALIEEGIGRGGLSRPDEAALHLGVACVGAGRTEKAVAAFKSIAVSGRDGAAVLARLWLARLGAL